MRTTVRIDDDLLARLKEQAHRDNVSLSKLVNQVIRNGLKKPQGVERRRRAYREKVFGMGQPQFDVNKALAVALALEDEEILRKLSLRK